MMGKTSDLPVRHYSCSRKTIMNLQEAANCRCSGIGKGHNSQGSEHLDSEWDELDPNSDFVANVRYLGGTIGSLMPVQH